MKEIACALCGNTQPSRLFRPPRAPGPVVRCQHCGLVYVSPLEQDQAIITAPVLGQKDPAILTSADTRLLNGFWELAQLPKRQGERPALRRNATAALRRLERYVRPPGRLLDFGCGWGFFLATARERGWEVYGLEPLPGHALYARAMVGATVTTDVLHDDTFPADHFDVITAFQVLEHLPDPAGNLHRLHRCLRPGGLILIEVPNIATWSVTLLGKRHRHFNPDHLTFFSPRTLRALLEKYGLEVLETYRPTRWMTLRYLFGHWGRWLLGRPPAPTRVGHTSWLQRLVVPLNFGDIVGAIGRKQT